MLRWADSSDIGLHVLGALRLSLFSYHVRQSATKKRTHHPVCLGLFSCATALLNDTQHRNAGRNMVPRLPSRPSVALQPASSSHWHCTLPLRTGVSYRTVACYPRACIAQASININNTMHCDSAREPKRSFLVDDQGQGTAEKAERAASLNPLGIRGLLLMNRVIWHIDLRRGTHLSCPTHAVVAQRADAPVRFRCFIPLPLGRNGETQGFLFATTD